MNDCREQADFFYDQTNTTTEETFQHQLLKFHHLITIDNTSINLNYLMSQHICM